MADRQTRDTDAKVFTIDKPDGVIRVEVEASAPNHEAATEDVRRTERAVRGEYE